MQAGAQLVSRYGHWNIQVGAWFQTGTRKNWPQIQIFNPCLSALNSALPIKSTIDPHGPDRLHEIKYDGYRPRVEGNGDRVRLITRGG
jgi:ATP-dependent DNA ligase